VKSYSARRRQLLGVMRWIRAVLTTLTLVATLFLTGVGPAFAAANMLVNPEMGMTDSTGSPLCWEESGYGTNVSTYSLSNLTYIGDGSAMQITTTQAGTGDRKAMMTENASCAPDVTPGHQYQLGVWYMSNTADVSITMFRHDTQDGWVYWQDLSTLPVANSYTDATVETPAVPANTDQITWGVSIYGVGTLITDDYSMYDVTPATATSPCSAGAACTQGSWQVLPFDAPVRAIHAVLMNNGDVLMIAGSGNDPDYFAAGTFESAVYDPTTGTFTVIPTPSDMFCAGHVQLPNGQILILGGTAAYPSADGSTGYEGLDTSYVFDPTSETYIQVNNLNDGHWYPSATELGNGDVLSLGGLRADSSGSVTAEYFSYAQMKWLPTDEVNQTWTFWGLYPAMILMQNGDLFYTGSHVFGGNITPDSSIYDYGSNTITAVSGLQDPNMTDQSMSVLLPPAQNQEVLTAGGGNIDTTTPAVRDTDLIDLSASTPTYTPGPLLPLGKLSDGSTEPSDEGKMYVSLVDLPDGKVLETGGGLIDREEPVYEASIYDPINDSFTPAASDPVPRTYHSSAFLLPDGRVMAVGNNPGDGSFDLRISVFTPPYLYDGARPQITSVASTQWTYGSTQDITVDTADGAVTSAELIRPAAVTHSSDPNQRYVDLPITVNGDGSLGLNVTSDDDIAPPGWYMLFVENGNGVPSVASWIQLT
jgi:hypothetical protein